MAIATFGLLPQPGRPERTRLCVVSDDEAIFMAVRLAFPDPSVIRTFEAGGLLSPQHDLSPHGVDVLRQARSADALLVDWQLDRAPVLNTLGFHLRTDPVTPLVALCRQGRDEEVAALAAGCDAAISFPLSPGHVRSIVLAHGRLVAAARAALPGADRAAGDLRHDEQAFGPLHIDRTACRLFVNGTEVQLTPREYSLLDYLLARQDELCTRDEILNDVWGINFDTGTNMVDVYMYFLRRKLEAHGAAGMIQTVRGRGYRLSLASPSSTVAESERDASAAGR